VSITLCSWNFGDGSGPSRFISPAHVYAVGGIHTETLTVTDTNGQTTTVSTTVAIAASPPLCQQPLLPTITGLSPCQGPPCPAASFNNECQTICPLTSETLLPNQCPGPATGNAIWTTGPFNVQINQPITVTVNTSVPNFSSLLAGATVQFDFGDGAVITNSPQGVPVAQSASTTTSVAGNTTTSTSTAAGTNLLYPYPPSMTANHAYTQPGSYTIKISMTFSDGTTAFNQTTATVTGQPAGLPLTPSGAPTVINASMKLQPGCNNVFLTFPNGTSASAVAAAVQGATVTSIYESPANAPQLAYFPSGSAAGQASNLASVQHGDAATICVSGPATLTEPPS
jgi:PKD repeat protein